MSCSRRLLLGLTLAVVMLPCRAAEEKKGDVKKEVPKITGVAPFAIVGGATNKLNIRGLSLTNATNIRWLCSPESAQAIGVEFKSRGKAKLPDKADPKKYGDTQLEIELFLPTDFPAGDLPFVMDTAEGETNTNLLFVVEKNVLLNEKEPNGNFRKPNSIQLPQTIRGALQEANDVDLFRFEAKAGQNLRLESRCTRYGSTLDSIVTLYDSAGHTLATCDDVKGNRDSLLRFTIPRDGAYFVSVMDAHDRGGVDYGYVLLVTAE